MPKATLLSAYKDKPRQYSLIIGKSRVLFEAGVPKSVSPSIAAMLKNKTEIVRDSRGRKTNRTRCMFKIEDMPEVKTQTKSVRSDTATSSKTSKTPASVKGQRRIA